MNIIKKILMASIGLYLVPYIIGLALPALDCYGWEKCEDPICPFNTYAIKIPEKGYLPCEKWNEYLDTEDEDLLIK